jgi:hypothetical protein
MRKLQFKRLFALVERGHGVAFNCRGERRSVRKWVAAMHIEGSPSRQPQLVPYFGVAVDRARVYADCTPRHLRLAFCRGWAAVLSRRPDPAAAADLDTKIGASAFDGFHKKPVHAYEPPSPYLRRQGEDPL